MVCKEIRDARVAGLLARGIAKHGDGLDISIVDDANSVTRSPRNHGSPSYDTFEVICNNLASSVGIKRLEM